jgi:hypothetical protein
MEDFSRKCRQAKTLTRILAAIAFALLAYATISLLAEGTASGLASAVILLALGLFAAYNIRNGLTHITHLELAARLPGMWISELSAWYRTREYADPGARMWAERLADDMAWADTLEICHAIDRITGEKHTVVLEGYLNLLTDMPDRPDRLDAAYRRLQAAISEGE